MKYRSDIDGLRTVAVVPILLFHAGFDALHGGFVGVDIFFVISGYLITSIVIDEMLNGKFSILQFYHRRVARIFPALFATLLVTLLVGGLTMFSVELTALGRSAAAAAGFAANVYFWFTTDYFAQAAEATPLLHTWSLGVEEQFYIFYPLVLLAIIRYFRSKIGLILWILVIGSFLVGWKLTGHRPTAAFYLIPARAWQLGLGGLVAVGAFPTISSHALRTVMSVAGAGLVAAGYVLIRSEMRFPVPWGLVPTAGAALMIAYAPGTIVGRGLSVRLLVAVGRISYSLYLVHWPIITFWRLENGFTLSVGESALLVVASFGAAIASFVLVEQPAMRLLRGRSHREVVGLGVVGIAAMALLALALSVFGPLRGYDASVRNTAAYSDYVGRDDYRVQFRKGPCFRAEGDPFDPRQCYALSEDRPNMVVLGDSHAAHVWRALADRFPERNVIQATASGCRPLVGGEGLQRCTEVMDHVFDKVLPAGRVSTLVLAGRWMNPDLTGLAATLESLKTRYPAMKIVVLGPTVEYVGEFPALLARKERKGMEGDVREFFVSERLEMDRKVEDIARRAGVSYVSIAKTICPNDCHLRAPDGGPMQFDYGHLTLSASRWVVEQMPGDVF